MCHQQTCFFRWEMCNILENWMKTELNLSNSSDLICSTHLVSLIYRLRINGLKAKYCKDVKYRGTHIFFNCLPYVPVPWSIPSFPTGVVYNPKYFVPFSPHLTEEFNWTTKLNCVWVHVMYFSTNVFSCVYNMYVVSAVGLLIMLTISCQCVYTSVCFLSLVLDQRTMSWLE